MYVLNRNTSTASYERTIICYCDSCFLSTTGSDVWTWCNTWKIWYIYIFLFKYLNQILKFHFSSWQNKIPIIFVTKFFVGSPLKETNFVVFGNYFELFEFLNTGAGIEVAKAMFGTISGIDVGPVRLPIQKLSKDQYTALNKDLMWFGSVNWL